MYKAKESRYESMQYNHSGKSGLKLPAVSLGLWHNFGDTASYSTMEEICFTAFDNGITHFDLANNYGPKPGAAEVNFGKIIKENFSAYRDELIISTKAGYTMWPGPYGDFGSRKYLISSLDQSLKRMGLEYVDIFYHHRPDPNTPLCETMEALAQIVRSGKALYVGLSNYDGERMAEAAGMLKELHVPFIINQNKYNLLDRTIETNGLKDMADKLGKGVICFCPLAQGLLTDRYLNGIPEDSRVRTDGRFLDKAKVEQDISKVRELKKLADKRGQSLAEMALAWLLKDEAITSVLVGASKAEQLLTNIRAITSAGFSDEELKLIDEIALNHNH